MYKTKKSPAVQEDKKLVLERKSTGERGRQGKKQQDNASEGVKERAAHRG
jgi:hypothetical protein